MHGYIARPPDGKDKAIYVKLIISLFPVKILPESDPMGRAIVDYFEHGVERFPLIVRSTLFDDDVMPVSNLFRTEAQMPEIEQRALALSRGSVLDVGAGAGCHTLALQQRGLFVTAIDISRLSVETMRRRGVVDARCADFFTDDLGQCYETILLLMNGLGIAGDLAHLSQLLLRAKSLLAPGGAILADSSDLRYVFEDEDGTFDYNPQTDSYYGEVDFSMHYDGTDGSSFNWLYVDFDTLNRVAADCGLQAELVVQGPHYDYLVRLKAED